MEKQPPFREFAEFAEFVRSNVERMLELSDRLYVTAVDKYKLWELYLSSFPEVSWQHSRLDEGEGQGSGRRGVDDGM